MCIIVYKPQNIKFPSKETLKNCFKNNPDGAGFMFAYKGKVHIQKGYQTFEVFNKELNNARRMTGDDVPYVLHFRISTQAHGRKDCTHPFPLSKDMEDLRKLETECEIGIAHNGIISLTSVGYSLTQITYSDTMKYITDILSLLIKDKNYYKNEDTMLLIERTCESKLAILDNDGHCELIGNFTNVNGIYYSNNSYEERKPIITSSWSSLNKDYKGLEKYYKDYDDDEDDWGYNDTQLWESFWNEKTEQYDFNPNDCPMSYADDYTDYYCDNCSHRAKCYYYEDEDENEDEEYER